MATEKTRDGREESQPDRETALLVLIIDDNADDREACMRTLSRSAGSYRFQTALDGASGLDAIATHKPDLVLLDYFLPGSNGLEVLGVISEHYPLLPVIMLTGQGSEAVAARGIKAGAIDYFSKSSLAAAAAIPVRNNSDEEGQTLHDVITAVMATRQRQQAQNQLPSVINALIIDDNPDDREACIRALRQLNAAQYRFAEAVDEPSGLEALAVRSPDVLLLDYSLPGSDGLKVLQKVRETHPFLPVIMMTGQGSEALAVRGIKAGAADYIPKSSMTGTLLHRSIVAAIEHNRDARTIDLQSQTIQRQREHLEDSVHFLDSLLDHIPDPVFVKNSGHRWQMVNRAFRELVGASGLSLADSGKSILPIEAAEMFWTHDDLALHSTEALVSEQSIPAPGGPQRLFSIKRATFCDRTGSRMLVGVMRDITSQRKAEDEFKQQAEQLMSQSQDLANLGAILDESLQEMFIVDASDLRILQANQGARRNLGYPQHELERLTVLEVTPQFTEMQLRKILEPLELGESKEAVYHASYRRKNGSLYDVEVHSQTALLHGRKAFIQIGLDETERKRIEHMKSEFISKVSHELRTPLTSIRGALGLMQAGAVGAMPEKAASMVRIADANAERLARLVDDILALEKSVSGNLVLDIRPTPVADLLRQAIESHAGYAERFKVQFVLEDAPSLPVMADPLRLMQVLSNLMSNAAKFSPAGGQVTVRAQSRGANVRFEVEDRGCGIPENFRPLIFEKFAQADSSVARRFQGTGLGLSITKELVEAMGGQIGFESEVGRGTTFFFDLPRTGKTKSKSGADHNSVCVLICEDDPDMRLIIKLAMEQAGFETTAVSTIKEAEQKLHEMSFAVMTLDLNLPDGDGLAFLKQLRNRAATSRMPVVVVSARAAEARRTFVGDSSSVDWLVKPLDQQMLVQSVRGALLRGESQLRLLYVGAENTTGNDLIQALNGLARVVLARDLTNCYQELRARHFDLLVVDPSLPKPAVKELLDHVRSGADDMPRVVVLAESELNLSERVRALALAE